MGDQFTPANWFWIFMAILLCCYIKVAAPKAAAKTPQLPVSVARMLW